VVAGPARGHPREGLTSPSSVTESLLRLPLGLRVAEALFFPLGGSASTMTRHRPSALQPVLERSTPADAGRHGLAWAAWPADLHTPVRLFLSLRAAGRRPCLLESAEGPARLARYSFLPVDPAETLLATAGGVRLQDREGEREVPGRAHEALRRVAGPARPGGLPRGLPPLTGGWIGCLAYEWAAELEPRVPVPETDPWGGLRAVFHRYRRLVALDHAAQTVVLVVPCPEGESGHARAQVELDALAGDLDHPPGPARGLTLLDPEPQPCTPREQYLAGVRELQEAIRAGEIFQAVLAQRFVQRLAGDPFVLYRVLRLRNPSPHMFYFEGGGMSLVGSSPERLVSVRDGRCQGRPIAGTRPRHEDPDEDDRLAAELLADPKERAEHDMLVDLARNDLGRVARIGTVQVKEHAVLEKFARVQHLVSRVECELASGRDALDALAASFPAGTVSGAPKIRAMELLARLEGETRGPYAGAFGYLDHAGNLDTAIVIRTLVVRDGLLHVQAGAGIVHDSVPEREYQETLDKSRALFEAAHLAGSGIFPATHGAEGTP